MRYLLIEKEGGHFFYLRHTFRGDMVFLNDKSCCFSFKRFERQHENCFHYLISIPSNILDLRAKAGMSGYGNIVKSCCNITFNKRYPNPGISVLFNKKSNNIIKEVNTSYIKVVVKTSYRIDRPVSIPEEKEILYLRSFIISCIKNPNPNIAKYIK